MALGKVATEKLDSARASLEEAGEQFGRILVILTKDETCNIQAFDSAGARVTAVRDLRIHDADLGEVIARLSPRPVPMEREVSSSGGVRSILPCPNAIP